MINKLKILVFTFCLILALCVADAAQNQIINTGVRKVSDNTVNFTFYTSGDSLEKPIVKSKGDNEYIILLPNLSGSSAGNINLNSVNGIVTSADVKTINEGAVTYTKINVKASKPITINAETRKTTQTASDISSINSIVSKVNLISSDIQSTKNVSPTTTVSDVSTQPAVRASSVKDIIKQNSAMAPKKNVIQEAVAVKSVSAHTPSVKKLDKSVNNKANSENIKNLKPIDNTVKSAKASSKPAVSAIAAFDKNNADSLKDVDEVALSNLATDDEILPSEDVLLKKIDEKELPNTEPVEPKRFSLFEGIKSILLSPFTTIILLTCILLVFFGFLFRKLTSNLSDTKSINDSFIEKLNSVLNKPKNKDFSQIVNNENMSWQEKYKAFNETNSEVDNAETKKINNEYVLELTNEQSEENEIIAEEEVANTEEIAEEEEIISTVSSSVENDDSHKFKGFANNAIKPISSVKPSQSHKLKSFSNDSTPARPLREKLENILDEDDIPNRSQINSVVTNTIAKQSRAANMRIIQNSAIDKDKEFYVINENGEYSLLGRVKNRLVILKHFGKVAPSDLQVRRGQGNVFIVKAGNFRTQVGVTDTDMNIYSQV